MSIGQAWGWFANSYSLGSDMTFWGWSDSYKKKMTLALKQPSSHHCHGKAGVQTMSTGTSDSRRCLRPWAPSSCRYSYPSLKTAPPLPIVLTFHVKPSVYQNALTSIKQPHSHGHTWAGGSQHWQGLSGVGLSSESLHKLFLALQKAEVPRKGSIEDKVHPWEVMEGEQVP